jgi:hypothetical protein
VPYRTFSARDSGARRDDEVPKEVSMVQSGFRRRQRRLFDLELALADKIRINP